MIMRFKSNSLKTSRYSLGLLGVMLSLLVLSLILSACTPQVATPAPDVVSDHWVAFSADHARENEMLKWLFSGDAEYWSPAEADITTLESGLPAYLQENKSAFYMTETLVWEQLNEYNRQYVGIVVDGRKIIYASYLCQNGSDTEWKKQFVFVADGGACYFQFKFDTSTGKFFDLQVNGEA